MQEPEHLTGNHPSSFLPELTANGGLLAGVVSIIICTFPSESLDDSSLSGNCRKPLRNFVYRVARRDRSSQLAASLFGNLGTNAKDRMSEVEKKAGAMRSIEVIVSLGLVSWVFIGIGRMIDERKGKLRLLGIANLWLNGERTSEAWYVEVMSGSCRAIVIVDVEALKP